MRLFPTAAAALPLTLLALPAFAQVDFTNELDRINTFCERTADPIIVNQDAWDELIAAGAEPGFIGPNAVDAVAAMCEYGAGISERREYDVDPVRRAIAAGLDEIRIVLRPDWDQLDGEPPEVAERPTFDLTDGVWTIGFGPTTRGDHDDWYYYWLGFNGGLEVDGFPLSEAREHSLAWAQVDEAKSFADPDCGVDFDVEMDWSIWTGDNFNLPWVEPFDAVINNHFGPDLLGDHCSNIVDAFRQECSNDVGKEFAQQYNKIRCRPDPRAPEWNDPYAAPLDYEMTNHPEGKSLWELRPATGELIFYFWAGSSNTGRDTEVLIQDGGGVPPRCDDFPEHCESFGDNNGTSTNNNGTNANNTSSNNNTPGENNATNGGTNGTSGATDDGSDDGCSTASAGPVTPAAGLLFMLVVGRLRRRASRRA